MIKNKFFYTFCANGETKNCGKNGVPAKNFCTSQCNKPSGGAFETRRPMPLDLFHGFGNDRPALLFFFLLPPEAPSPAPANRSPTPSAASPSVTINKTTKSTTKNAAQKDKFILWRTSPPCHMYATCPSKKTNINKNKIAPCRQKTAFGAFQRQKHRIERASYIRYNRPSAKSQPKQCSLPAADTPTAGAPKKRSRCRCTAGQTISKIRFASFPHAVYYSKQLLFCKRAQKKACPRHAEYSAWRGHA